MTRSITLTSVIVFFLSFGLGIVWFGCCQSNGPEAAVPTESSRLDSESVALVRSYFAAVKRGDIQLADSMWAKKNIESKESRPEPVDSTQADSTQVDSIHRFREVPNVPFYSWAKDFHNEGWELDAIEGTVKENTTIETVKVRLIRRRNAEVDVYAALGIEIKESGAQIVSFNFLRNQER